ncbi:cytosolic endo-beta-N-acetylglucosaminidase isoform X2 [Polyodon spathula]|nr:cytosolic endo-beta-N-acetylglucosaminidase isoform X2 [Polyodon spathula]
MDLPVDRQFVSHLVQFNPSPLQGRHYDLDTTEPVSFSLKSLEELLSWKPSDADAFNIATTPLASRQPPLQSSRPKTLVCHDMMGGYQEDRFIQGAEAETAYSFYHWQYIDIFNYFSHNLVTVPPVCWTNAAHRHGVSVLGTFITEWSDGANICESFLAEKSSFHAVADKLVQIAQYYGFDGWLINIENKLSESAVKNMPSFLRYLTDRMHRSVPESLIIWYDSVLETGELKWQNELNEKNSVFFDSCDGIFTNYNWMEDHLERMVSQAPKRLAEVYVGVDVFARGAVIGGKFDTNKALQLIRKHSFSAAIFAPGWVYECNEKKDFRQHQGKFWSLLFEYLPTHSVCVLPFVTSFCQGFGKHMYSKGKVEEVKNWFNLSAQELQPLFVDMRSEAVENGWVWTRGCPEDAWNGGSSLLVEGVIPASLSNVSVRLFSVRVPAPPKIFISFIYKLEGVSDVKVALELKTHHAPFCSFVDIADIPASSLRPETLPEQDSMVQQFTQRCGTWTLQGWQSRCFLLDLKGCLLEDIFVNISQVQPEEQEVHFLLRIGEMKVLDAESLFTTQPQVQNPSMSDVVWRRGMGVTDTLQLYLSATLRWSYPANHASHFRVHWRKLRCPEPRALSEQERAVFIGRAYASVYRVVDLAVPDAVDGDPCWMEFLVQPVSKEGFTGPESEWGRLTLRYAEHFLSEAGTSV